jgi:hypothetical protein
LCWRVNDLTSWFTDIWNKSTWHCQRVLSFYRCPFKLVNVLPVTALYHMHAKWWTTCLLRVYLPKCIRDLKIFFTRKLHRKSLSLRYLLVKYKHWCIQSSAQFPIVTGGLEIRLQNHRICPLQESGFVHVSAATQVDARVEVWLVKEHVNNMRAANVGVLYTVLPGTGKDLSEWL